MLFKEAWNKHQEIFLSSNMDEIDLWKFPEVKWKKRSEVKDWEGMGSSIREEGG